MNDASKKLLKILIGIIVFIIVIILVCVIISKFKGNDYTYNEVENLIVDAAKNYANNNQAFMPINNNDTVEVDLNTLISNEYIEELSEYMKDETINCSGKVTITKTGEYYYFAPYLACGDKYETKLLSDKLLETVVSEKDGLYVMNQFYKNQTQKSYIFRGEFPNNYILLNGNMWRIVKINPDNTITVIMDFINRDLFETNPWDNRYNITIDDKLGINDFETSRLKDRLKSYYDNNLSSNLKEKIVAKKLCIGARSIFDKANDGTIECSKYSEEEMYLSILPMYDFMNVSLDKNCKLPEDKSCINYNYLNKYSLNWWLLTTNSKATYRGYIISGNITRANLSSSAYDRLVAVLNSNVVYTGGNGTSDNPYRIK